MMRVIPIELIIGPNFVAGAPAGLVYRLLNCDRGLQDKDRINANPPKPYVQLRRKKPASRITEILIGNFSGPKTAKN